MLDDPDEREVGIVDVQPVDNGEAAVQFQDNAKVGEIADTSQAFDIGAWRVRRNEIGNDGQRRGDDRGENDRIPSAAKHNILRNGYLVLPAARASR